MAGLLAAPAKLMENWPPLAEKFRRLTGGMLRLREWLEPVKETWHQFRVLTGRYLELIWSDKRGRFPMDRRFDPTMRRAIPLLDEKVSTA